MPQDSGPEFKNDSALSAASARLLNEVKAEPVPQSIAKLAQELDRALQIRRKAASTD